MKRNWGLIAAFIELFAFGAGAAGPGSEVVVVYNSRVPASKDVAEHYAERRQVPASQVFGFPLPSGSDFSRAEFEDLLQKPLAAKLHDAKLWHIGSELVSGTNGAPGRLEWKVKESKIRYAVLCYGVPYRITKDPSRHDDGEDKLRPELRRNEAAVDSELALLPCVEQHLPLAGPLSNPAYSATNSDLFHPTNNLLMVTRLDGPTADIARHLVDKAMEAETNGLWGRAYFDLRGTTDPNYKIGDDWIRNAAEICRRLGFETLVDDNPATFPAEYPMSQIAFYCGWYDGRVSGPFTRATVEFMPGAFAYHLHSYSAANLRSSTENWVGPLLAKGATITMGCVDEPYLGGTPEVAVFVSRLIFYGMSFGEAAYASQPVLSWQTTFVGDPLYRPFGKPPQLLHLQLEARRSKFREWSHLRVVDLNIAKGLPIAASVGYLEQLELTRSSAVLSEKLADLYEEEGKPSSAIELDERALKLDPSPEQRIRLRLTLGERLSASNRSGDAYENYVRMLQENTDYPNKLVIYRKILPLAQKLGRKDDVQRYEELIRQLSPPPVASQ